MDQPNATSGDAAPDASVTVPPGEKASAQGIAGTCSACGGAKTVDPDSEAAVTRSYVYAMGRVEPRLPSPAVEKEFAQATGRAETVGQTDRQALQTVLSDRANRYLVRQLCWTFTVQGLETYILRPRDTADFDVLVESLRPNPSPMDVDVVVGVRGPLAPPGLCGGLVVPIVFFDQLYFFDRKALIAAIPRPEGVSAQREKNFRATAEELFDRIMQLTDNHGASDKDRALNYLALRYPALYAQTADANQRNFSLTGVDVRPSPLSGVRRIVDVVFSLRNRQTDVSEQSFVRVDVTEEFPFVVTKWSLFLAH